MTGELRWVVEDRWRLGERWLLGSVGVRDRGTMSFVEAVCGAVAGTDRDCLTAMGISRVLVVVML